MFRDEESYRREYANVLDYKFPDLHIEVVSYAELMQPGKLNPEGFYDFIHTNKPDIVTILPVPGLFEQLIEQGSLLALDNFIAKDKFDIDQFAPLVTTLLRAKGQGSLYGLPTSFSSQALYYNKRLFDEFKIAYPHNGMSFEEVLQLAYRFTERQTEQPVAGFYKKGMTPGAFLLYAGDLLGLQWIDSAARNITIGTPAWAKVFANVTGAYKSGAIFDANVLQSGAANAQTVKDFELMIEQSRKNNLFAAGKAAMTLEPSGFINDGLSS
ncbi:ABC transporter substrate-binding protein [Paenibacillus ginsengarvi]|nr:extracellular solute-binding protein [Paenibacillus ginsengarvi]